MNYENLSVNEKVIIRNLLKVQVENGFVNKAMDFNVKIYLEAIKVAVLANCPNGRMIKTINKRYVPKKLLMESQ
ncbi:MAG: hypothetical protein FWC45_09565 [Treponema sp.]|nr:hypothetical protein [Treponema sp.]